MTQDLKNHLDEDCWINSHKDAVEVSDNLAYVLYPDGSATIYKDFGREIRSIPLSRKEARYFGLFRPFGISGI